MKILLSGASGLIGKKLQASWPQVEWVRLERYPSRGALGWSIAGRPLGEEMLKGVDAVIHLAGENVAKKRWSRSQKENIKNSRVLGTQRLVDILVSSSYQPKVVIAASAVGYYGDAGGECLDEHSPSGEGFLAEVCREWEGAWEPLASTGIRLVIARLGVVLADGGGVLSRMLPLFKMGLGGRLGTGQQYMSWIDLDDVVSAFKFFLDNTACRGVFNVTSPEPVTNAAFTRELGRQLGRPTYLALPSFMLKLVFGQMGETLFLASARSLPRHLLAMDFPFRYPSLPEALKRYTHGQAG